MKEKIFSFVHKKPLLTGLIGGFLLYLLLAGLVRMLPDGVPDGAFRNAEPILREDYLRLAVRDYAVDANADRAEWRFSQLGEDGPRLLELLKKDELTDPLALLRFVAAVSETGFPDVETQPLEPAGAVSTPGDIAADAGGGGIPLIGIVFIVLVALILLCLLFLFFFSERGSGFRAWVTKLGEKDFRSIFSKGLTKKRGQKDDDKISWSVREDDDFDLGVIINRFPDDDDDDVPVRDEAAVILQEADSMIDDEFEVDGGVTDADSTADDTFTETDGPDFTEAETDDPDTGTDEAPEEDIQFSKIAVHELEIPASSEKPEPTVADTAVRPQSDKTLMHFQTVYQLGDDLFDETFSLDEDEDRFLGECGIGIAETINSTDPKAVTAFEIWLFDREDVQTPTYFLLSDFAFSNEQMINRLKNKGRFDRLVKGGEYALESHTLKMKVRISELEYGSENGEKNSYFNKVGFDVTVWKK